MDNWLTGIIVLAILFVFVGRAITHWWFRINEQIAELKAIHAALDKLNTSIDMQNSGLQAMHTEIRTIRSRFTPPTQ